jgi:hypothetical protein
MTTIAVTGHMDISEDSIPRIKDALLKLFSQYTGDLIGVSCIARGADTLFAEAILDAGGRLTVILPSSDYRAAKVASDHAPTFDRLIAAAAEVIVTHHETANRAAYETANNELLRRAERLVAIWDGSPPSGKGGGTADTVVLARERNILVDVVWPAGAQRG